MTDATGMGPNSPAPRLDPNCQCICHTQPGVMHVAACCSAPSLASSPEVAALIREAEARGMERAAEMALSCGIAVNANQRDAIAAAIRAAKATP